MTIQEVKNNFVQNLAENAYINMCSVEEMNIVIEALEKQMPKKIEILGSADSILGMREYCCPHCGQLMAKFYDFEIFVCVKGDYCCNCGQALDWNDLKGETK